MLTIKEIKSILNNSDIYNNLISTGKILCSFIGGSYKNGLFIEGVSDYDVIMVFEDTTLLINGCENIQKKYVYTIEAEQNIHLILQPSCVTTGQFISSYHLLAALNLRKSDMLYINDAYPEFTEQLLKLVKTDKNIIKKYFALSTIINNWFELQYNYVPANLNSNTEHVNRLIFRELFFAFAVYFEGNYLQYAEELDILKHGAIIPKVVKTYSNLYNQWSRLGYNKILKEYNVVCEQYKSLLYS